jgi:hypothetical protein
MGGVYHGRRRGHIHQPACRLQDSYGVVNTKPRKRDFYGRRYSVTKWAVRLAFAGLLGLPFASSAGCSSQAGDPPVSNGAPTVGGKARCIRSAADIQL